MRPVLLAALALTVLPAALPAQDAPADGAPRISQEEFKKAWKDDTVLVIDVRDGASYGLGHIPGALSVPEAKLAEHFEALKSQKKPIVAYCG
jgi:rhodanese-related sulfurtransferase